jgi:hypothetical protein
MINCQSESLPAGQDRSLRVWLAKPEAQILIRVAEAKCKIEAAQALDESIKSKDHENYLLAANETLRRAQRYATFLDVLKEISSQTEPFTTVKLT